MRSGTFSTTYHKYYTCGVNGCSKQYRAVISLHQIDREEDKPSILEHMADEAHDHDGVDVVFRGGLFPFVDKVKCCSNNDSSNEVNRVCCRHDKRTKEYCDTVSGSKGRSSRFFSG